MSLHLSKYHIVGNHILWVKCQKANEFDQALPTITCHSLNHDTARRTHTSLGVTPPQIKKSIQLDDCEIRNDIKKKLYKTMIHLKNHPRNGSHPTINNVKHPAILSYDWKTRKNAKNQLFEENKHFDCIFYRIEVQVISNPSNRLEKNHQILKLLLMTEFYDVLLKKANFLHFPIFTIIISCTYSNHCMCIILC